MLDEDVAWPMGKGWKKSTLGTGLQGGRWLLGVLSCIVEHSRSQVPSGPISALWDDKLAWGTVRSERQTPVGRKQKQQGTQRAIPGKKENLPL